MRSDDALDMLREWFSLKGWAPLGFQEESWSHYLAGRNGLIHVPTGSGKTFAAYFGPLAHLLEDPKPGLNILYITPLRATSRDIELSLRLPLEQLGLDGQVSVGSRTGDTSSSERRKQAKQLPNVLVTTPESLQVLLSYADAKKKFQNVKCVIVDEWHELMSSKRGTQFELGAARVRHWSGCRTWAMSATVSNLLETAEFACGTHSDPVLVTQALERPVIMDTIVTENIDALPWHGHMGLKSLSQVLKRLNPGKEAALVFTNTRNQAENWFRAILDEKPHWEPWMALHHGSVDMDERRRIEHGMKSGEIRLTVCTSSMDLGVDFSPVERVIQIGSPKGIARVLQRAGRAAHRPGEPCRISFVPTNALELFELAGVRRAIDRGIVEARHTLAKPLDVLAQHMVTCALGGGIDPDDFFNEVRRATSYEHLQREEFDWTLDLVVTGGNTLKAYDQYKKVIPDEAGIYRVPEKKIAALHRSNIGTIENSQSIQVRFKNGMKLGTVEERFLSKLEVGDTFAFAGRILRLDRLTASDAYVTQSKSDSPQTPAWGGGRFPVSTELADVMMEVLEDAKSLNLDCPELELALPVIERQLAVSTLPTRNELLAEILESKDGHHLFLYPFGGWLANEGLATVLAYRMGQHRSANFSLGVNDYGIEFMSATPFPFREMLESGVLFEGESDALVSETELAVNLTELTRRAFRSVARVSGLVNEGLPGRRKKAKHVETSSSLLFDVFQRWDPENLLLAQARREVFEKQLEVFRIERALTHMKNANLVIIDTPQPSALAFPLMVTWITASRNTLRTESIEERVERLKRQWTT